MQVLRKFTSPEMLSLPRHLQGMGMLRAHRPLGEVEDAGEAAEVVGAPYAGAVETEDEGHVVVSRWIFEGGA